MAKPGDKTKPWLDPASVTPRVASIYPAPFAAPLAGREKRALGDPLRLTQFGVNLVTLAPGAWSSQRHWHAKEDEFIYVLSGEITLVTKDGEQVLKPSMAVGFPCGDRNGHQLVNRGSAPATYLEIGTRSPDDDVTYPDIDMVGRKRDGRYAFTRKTGEPFP